MPPVRQHAYRHEPFPFAGPLEEDFVRALDVASRKSNRSIGALQQATKTCVRQLKEDGMTPEGVIITMRAYLRSTAQMHAPPPDPNEPNVIYEILCDHLAKWCIDEYYGVSEGERSKTG